MHRIVALALLMVLLALPSLAQACPGCKEALGSNDPHQLSIVRGYFWSILFMMSMPFLLIGSFCLYMWREVRRARQAALQHGSSMESSARETAGV